MKRCPVCFGDSEIDFYQTGTCSFGCFRQSQRTIINSLTYEINVAAQEMGRYGALSLVKHRLLQRANQALHDMN